MTENPVTYAVVRVGGKQYKVSAGDQVLVDRLAVDEGKSLTLETLLVRTTDGSADPKTAKVKARVLEHVLGQKIRVFTYKPKSTFKKTRGHRSRLSRIAIESIALKEKKSGS
ncbi:MAG: 50S ribosomal protein L21 [Actinobacteria bacterium]|jgi:large subunit ribosomal protein L21|nr:50S ribosomal protein L21 [Actinomycetota bacterium]